MWRFFKRGASVCCWCVGEEQRNSGVSWSWYCPRKEKPKTSESQVMQKPGK